MHTKPMKDSEGTFLKPEEKLYKCSKCGENTVSCRLWESSDGAYEDYKYECTNKNCNYSWWVDGIDS